MTRKLSSLQIVDSIKPLPGSDRLEIVTVLGWQVVVQKGKHRVGEVVIFVEPDAVVDTNYPCWSDFHSRGKLWPVEFGQSVFGMLVKPTRIRGVISQALVVPCTETLRHHEVGSDVSVHLKVHRYNPVVTERVWAGDPAGDFPTDLVRKTDSERVQNLRDDWLAGLDPVDWEASEKIDGCSLTVIETSSEPIVCSRNHRRKPGSGLYCEAADKLLPFMSPGQIAQAEVYGPGIQKNPLNRPSREVRVFWSSTGTSGFAAQHVVPRLALVLPKTVEQCLRQADGLTSLISPGRLAEGIVWRHRDGKCFTELGGGSTFKVLNATYLVKQ